MSNKDNLTRGESAHKDQGALVRYFKGSAHAFLPAERAAALLKAAGRDQTALPALHWRNPSGDKDPCRATPDEQSEWAEELWAGRAVTCRFTPLSAGQDAPPGWENMASGAGEQPVEVFVLAAELITRLPEADGQTSIASTFDPGTIDVAKHPMLSWEYEARLLAYQRLRIRQIEREVHDQFHPGPTPAQPARAIPSPQPPETAEPTSDKRPRQWWGHAEQACLRVGRKLPRVIGELCNSLGYECDGDSLVSPEGETFTRKTLANWLSANRKRLDNLRT